MTTKPKSTSSPIFIVTLWWTGILTLVKLFESSLLEILTVFLYPILLLFGYFGLLILLVLSVIYWIRQRNNSERPFIPFLFSILTIIFFLYFPFTRLTLEIDFRVKKSDREKVVKMITNKEIQYDLTKSSSVKIPAEYSNLSAGSPNVEVEVIDKKTCIFFYTFRGITDNTSGFVYVPDESVITKIKVGRSNQSNIFYEPIQITKIAEHWYFVANT